MKTEQREWGLVEGGGQAGVRKGRNNTTEAYSKIVGKDSNTSP